MTSLVNERGLIAFALSKSFAYLDEQGRTCRSKLAFPLTHSTINILGERRDKTANEKQKTGISIDGCLLGWLRALKKAREMWVSTRTNDQTTFGCYDRAELKQLSRWGKQTEENRPSRQSSTPKKRRKQSTESV